MHIDLRINGLDNLTATQFLFEFYKKESQPLSMQNPLLTGLKNMKKF